VVSFYSIDLPTILSIIVQVIATLTSLHEHSLLEVFILSGETKSKSVTGKRPMPDKSGKTHNKGARGGKKKKTK
jgi:hypothetical protein